MFTGRIDEIGEIESVIDEKGVVLAPKTTGRVRAGESLSVAGVCHGGARRWRRGARDDERGDLGNRSQGVSGQLRSASWRVPAAPWQGLPTSRPPRCAGACR